MKSIPLLLLAVLVSAGCAVRPPAAPDDVAARNAYEARSNRIAAWTDWGLSGRLGIDGGDEGGSGRLDWRTEANGSSLQFRGAFGKGAWRLSIDADGALLERADGARFRAPTADALAYEQTGWRVPVSALEWWVRGLAQPGGRPSMELDEAGLPKSLEQHGWRVTFEDFDDAGGIELPGRVEAVKGDYQVKLAIRRWWHEDEGDA